MAVKIRLRRVGKRNAACHRIVVADGRSPRDGRFIENIGTYDPRAKAQTIDLERADYWIGNGAQPSDTVAAIIKRARAGISLAPAAETATVEPEAATVEPEAATVEPEAATVEPEAEAVSVEEPETETPADDGDVATEAADEQV